MIPEPSILTVDDDPTVRRALERALRGLGYRTVGVGSAYEALDHLRRDETVSLVLLDLHMPGESGMELARRIRRGEAGPWHRELPVVFVTSDDGVEPFEDSFDVGAHGFLPKPFRLEDIIDQVRSILPYAEAE